MNKIRKRIISLGIVGALSLLPGVEGRADFSSFGDECYNNEDVLVYDRDSFEGEIIGTLEVNSYLYRILKGDNCSLINYHEHLGFVDNNSLVSISEGNNNHTYQDMNKIAVTTSKVNLRVGASTDDVIADVLEEGQDVKVLAIVDNGWYLVDSNNNLGFVSGDYLKIIDEEDILSEMEELPDIMKYAVAKKDVNVHDNPSLDSNVLGIMKRGKQVHIVQEFDDGWIEVERNGMIGYIYNSNIDEKYVINGDPTFIVSLKSDSLVYKSPYGEEIGLLPQYEACFVYGETSTHYLIETEGRVGYIKKSNCEKLKGVFVIVDISSQKMVQFRGCIPEVISDVVTGKDSTPTDLGLYSIHSKVPGRYLVGDDYVVYVNYWMGFNKDAGEGLHDIKRRKFGGEIYHEKGSHGCVNLPYKKAEELFQNVSVGDKVLIKR